MHNQKQRFWGENYKISTISSTVVENHCKTIAVPTNCRRATVAHSIYSNQSVTTINQETDHLYGSKPSCSKRLLVATH